MRTPSRMPASEFSQSLKHFLNYICVLNHHRLCCGRCGAPIVYVRAALQLHRAFCPACAGVETTVENRAWNTMVPYCPICEEKPAERGCLHPTDFSSTKDRVRGAICLQREGSQFYRTKERSD